MSAATRLDPITAVAVRLPARLDRTSPGPAPDTHRMAAVLAGLPGLVVSDERSVTWIRSGRRLRIGRPTGSERPARFAGEGARPVLRWLGSKTWALDAIAEWAAQLAGDRGPPLAVFGEPFAGGAALTLALASRGLLRGARVLLGDRNGELVNLYRAIQRDPAGLWRAVAEWPCEEATFYAVRAGVPAAPIPRAARTLYLNRLCHGGVYRTNRHGAFNSPWGYRDGLGITFDDVLAASQALADVELLARDAGAIIEQVREAAAAGRRAAVYADPPYLPEPWADAGGFTYGEPYEVAHHVELARQLAECVEAGADVALSNAWAAEALGLATAAGLEPRALWTRRRIQPGGDRSPVPEMLATSSWPEVTADVLIECAWHSDESRARALRDLLGAARKAGLLTGREAGYEAAERAARPPLVRVVERMVRHHGVEPVLMRGRLRAELPAGRLDVGVGRRRFTFGGRSVGPFSGPDAVACAVAAELAAGAYIDLAPPAPSWLDRVLAGELVDADVDRALVDRLGLLDDAEPSAWLRAEVERHLRRPGPDAIASPAAVAGVVNRAGRCIAVDGVAIRHVDVDALDRWLAWAHERAEARGRRLTWRLAHWGPAIDPGPAGHALVAGRLDPPATVFERHRRSAETRTAVLSAAPPARTREPVRTRFEGIARLALAGWSITELAIAAGTSRSAVHRALRSAQALGRDPSFGGPWLAVEHTRVVVVDARPDAKGGTR